MTVEGDVTGNEPPEDRERSGPWVPGAIALTIAGLVLGAVIVTAGGAEGAPLELPHQVRVPGIAYDGAPDPPVLVEPAAVTRRSGAEDGWRGLICSFPWPCDEALRVSQIESGGNAYAVNPSTGACGLFGLYPCTCIDPECNVAAAFTKWAESGSFFDHWYRWWD